MNSQATRSFDILAASSGGIESLSKTEKMPSSQYRTGTIKSDLKRNQNRKDSWRQMDSTHTSELVRRKVSPYPKTPLLKFMGGVDAQTVHMYYRIKTKWESKSSSPNAQREGRIKPSFVGGLLHLVFWPTNTY